MGGMGGIDPSMGMGGMGGMGYGGYGMDPYMGGMGMGGGMGGMGKAVMGTMLVTQAGSSLTQTGTQIANTVLENTRRADNPGVSGVAEGDATSTDGGNGEADDSASGGNSNTSPENNTSANGKSGQNLPSATTAAAA
uniref:Uncharacterized protein n=1 Tax=Rhipicephalus microplus TaxID=6941 RepID=A0A6G5A4I7_RHIMP